MPKVTSTTNPGCCANSGRSSCATKSSGSWHEGARRTCALERLRVVRGPLCVDTGRYKEPRKAQSQTNKPTHSISAFGTHFDHHTMQFRAIILAALATVAATSPSSLTSRAGCVRLHRSALESHILTSADTPDGREPRGAPRGMLIPR